MLVGWCCGSTVLPIAATRTQSRIDLDEDIALPLRQVGITPQLAYGRRLFDALRVEDTSLQVKRFRRQPQSSRQRLDQRAAGIAQPPFDLAEDRRRDAALLGELAQ